MNITQSLLAAEPHCLQSLGVKGVQVEEIWSFDPESFSRIK